MQSKYQLSDWDLFYRYLICGQASGLIEVPVNKDRRNAQALNPKYRQGKPLLDKLAAEDGRRFVATLEDISVRGRAPNQDATIYALAVAASVSNSETRRLALQALPRICRTASHLFSFLNEIAIGNRGQKMRGWGRGLRSAVIEWYTEKSADALAYQMLKYRSRQGWSHRDVLRKAGGERTRDRLTMDMEALLRWAVVGADLGARTVLRGERSSKYGALKASHLPKLIRGCEAMAGCSTPEQAVRLINSYHLTHEMVLNDFKKDPAVWEALLPRMPLTALIRNLGRMQACGLLEGNSETVKFIGKRLDTVEAIRKARLHPMSTLVSLTTYGRGSGDKGSLTWTPNQRISDAVEAAFYHGFETVEPSGTPTRVAVDVSGSMTWKPQVHLANLCPRDIAAVMSMVIARSEPESQIVAFSSSLQEVNVSSKDSISDVIRKFGSLRFGATNCAAPVTDALASKTEFGNFVVITDNETNRGGPPAQAIRAYRDQVVPTAKLSVVAVEPVSFSIADGSPFMMDVSGFDTSTPALLSSFGAT